MAALPAYGVQLNTKFNGTLEDTLVVKRTGSPVDTTYYIPWNVLDGAKQEEVDGVLSAYGAYQSATGSPGYLLTVVDPTAGSQTVNFGGTLAGSPIGGSPYTATGLSNATNTAGVMTVPLNQVGSPEGDVVGGDNTGLANNATVYSAFISVDGGAQQHVTVVGSAAQTYTALLSQINTDLTGATASLSSGDLIVTSGTTGANSRVTFGSGNLFSSLSAFAGPISSTDGTAEVTYLATITVDGVAYPITVVGNAAQTWADLITEINTDLAAGSPAATVAVSGGNLVVTSPTTPTGQDQTSTVEIKDNGLFRALTDFVGIDRENPGVYDFEDLLRNYITGRGTPLGHGLPIRTVGQTPDTATAFKALKVSDIVYFDGSVWRHTQSGTTA